MSNSKYYINYIYDTPIVYKELTLHPVKVKDFVYFNFFVQCLLIDKNSIPDINIISMSYLDFLFYSHNNENNYASMLDALLRICLNFEQEGKNIKYGYTETGKAYFKPDGCSLFYTGEDLEEIKTIICEQNLVELPDEKIQKEIRDKMEEAKRIRERMNNSKMASFEDQLIALMVSCSYTFEEVCNLSIRKFIKALQRLDLKLHYEIYLGASMSGMVEFKDKSFIKHWLSEIEPKEKEELVSLDNVKKQVSSV